MGILNSLFGAEAMSAFGQQNPLFGALLSPGQNGAPSPMQQFGSNLMASMGNVQGQGQGQGGQRQGGQGQGPNPAMSALGDNQAGLSALIQRLTQMAQSAAGGM